MAMVNMDDYLEFPTLNFIMLIYYNVFKLVNQLGRLDNR